VSVLPDALKAHLEGAVTTVCHCWRVTRRDGRVLGFSDHDGVLVLGGTTFRPASGFSATEARDRLGLAVDTVDVEGALSADEIDEADIAAGAYDDATVETLLVNWREPDQVALLRRATIGKITRRDGAFAAELKSPAHALDRVGGRRVSRACDADLADARCRFVVDQPGFTMSGAVVRVIGRDRIVVADLDAAAPGWFALGRLEWTSGGSTGRIAHVLSHATGDGGVVLRLQGDEGMRPAEGDGFVVRAGCDKAFATCRSKFANAVNFQGFPHLPGNDAAYGYAVDGDVFDGSPLVP
jgi:uncharacterized phage protein (TIGR02218 family)